MPKLFLAYLGGKMLPNRIGEDHEVVLVVAEDKVEAKAKAQAKWKGEGAAHLDMLTEVDIVDNYVINLEKTMKQDKMISDDDWHALNDVDK
ncbi:MAG: DUF1543 domain-containing protein [Candidatus Magasanikbacteria bacterium]